MNISMLVSTVYGKILAGQFMNRLLLIANQRLLAVVMLFATLLVIQPAHAQSTPEQGQTFLPGPTGPYSVGRTIHNWTDSSRDEIYSDTEGAKRELVVWILYPAEPSQDAQPAAYAPGELGDLLETGFNFSTEQISTHAYEDAPIAGLSNQYPVLVFSNGNGSLLSFYSALLVEIASHGYIVVGIQHPYNAPFTVFEDGHVITAIPEAVTVSNVSLQYWTEDTAFVIDQLEILNGGSDKLAGRLDISRFGIFGHSFGGSVAAEFCLTDTRCFAGANLDGSYLGVAAEQGVTRPFMQVFSDTSCEEVVASGSMSSEACQQLFEQNQVGWQKMLETAQPGYSLNIGGSRHGTFTDIPFLLSIVPQFADGATIDPERAWRITSDYLLGFFDQHVKNEHIPLLTGPSSDYPEVTFERRTN